LIAPYLRKLELCNYRIIVKIGYATQDRTRANPCSFPSTGFLRYMGEISGLASPRLIWLDLGRFHTPRHRRAVTIIILTYMQLYSLSFRQFYQVVIEIAVPRKGLF